MDSDVRRMDKILTVELERQSRLKAELEQVNGKMAKINMLRDVSRRRPGTAFVDPTTTMPSNHPAHPLPSPPPPTPYPSPPPNFRATSRAWRLLMLRRV